jgi:hypothetical protein
MLLHMIFALLSDIQQLTHTILCAAVATTAAPLGVWSTCAGAF